MTWRELLNDDPLPWLLESDPENPGVRYFALTALLDRPPDAPDVRDAKAAIMQTGPVPAILAGQHPDGYWVKPGSGYSPKYRSTVWSVIFLAQLGADAVDPRVRAGGEYLLDNARSAYGGFTAAMNLSPAGMIHCLQGNLCAALLDLGWAGDPRLDVALDWLARSVTGEGIAPAAQKDAEVRYYRSGNSGPGFPCSANDHLPCAWGAVKVLLALSKVSAGQRTPAADQPLSAADQPLSARQAAIEEGIEFLLSCDPATAEYPAGYSDKPSTSWFRFGFPVFYVTDVLQNLETLTALGCGRDPRLANALDLLLSKQDRQGRWKMSYAYKGKTWADVEATRKPSKWVTLRALRVLKRAA